jgi:hypothetical protein
MRSLALLTSVLVCVGAAACGDLRRRAGAVAQRTSRAAIGSSTRSSAGAARARQHIFGDYDNDDYDNTSDNDYDDNDKPTDRDDDSDSHGGGYYDGDDAGVRAFGHAASPAEGQAIATLVKSYYAAAAAADGAKACSMIHPAFARTFPPALGEAGPSYLHGAKTCSEVMSRLFKQNHMRMAAYAVKLEVAGVRLTGSHGLVVLAFRTLPGRQIEVEREHGSWKLDALVDRALP